MFVRWLVLVDRFGERARPHFSSSSCPSVRVRDGEALNSLRVARAFWRLVSSARFLLAASSGDVAFLAVSE
eukprot:8988557-Alexandrium_andersonii.AAC.1